MTHALKLALALFTTLALGLITAAAAKAATAPASYQPPAHLRVAKVSTHSFLITWDASTGPGFVIAAYTSTGKLVRTLTTGNAYATVGNLTAGQKYTARVGVNAPGAPYAQVTATVASTLSQQVAAYVQTLEGIPYLYGGSSPRGFDCSGLTQYVYGHFNQAIQRTADAQFRQFRPVSQAQSVPGDLVFFHDTTDPSSHVYHVGVYEGGQTMVDSPHSGTTVRLGSFAWAGNTVTFGTVSH